MIGQLCALLFNTVFAFAFNMVFNSGTMDDRQLILDLGGPTKVAVMLGLDKAKGGVQRVQNWMTRGIPPKVKLERPDLFLRHLGASPAAASTDQDGGQSHPDGDRHASPISEEPPT
jgi:hypothetical protein